MKTFKFTAGAASLAAFLFLAPSAIRAQETPSEKSVVLRTADGNCVSTAPSGGLDLSGKSVTDKTTFVIIDSNGGEPADGDEVKIKYTPGQSADAGKNKPSFWQEAEGKVNRTNKEPSDNSAKFKLKQQGDGFVLQAASGKFVAAPVEGGLGLADAPEGGLVLKIEVQASPQP